MYCIQNELELKTLQFGKQSSGGSGAIAIRDVYFPTDNYPSKEQMSVFDFVRKDIRVDKNHKQYVNSTGKFTEIM